MTVGRGRPFQPGNRQGRGRPRGSRNKTTRVCAELLEENAALLMRKCILLAAQGDRVALRLCLDRIMPLRRSQPVEFRLPRVRKSEDLWRATEALLRSVATADLTAEEAEKVANILEMRRKAIETEELDKRLQALEAEREGKRS